MFRATLAVLAAAAALALAGTAGAATPKLIGTDGPGFTITLKDASGKTVKTLKKGTYTIAIADKSNIHNFHLTGPGVNKKTDVGFTGSKTWTVTLKPGTYKYVCDPHATTMKGSFKVS
jgi:plastocyanin